MDSTSPGGVHGTSWLPCVARTGLVALTLGCAAVGWAEEAGAKKTEVVVMPKFEVSEPGMTDFGMSIITNPQVAKGGKIAWMLVGVIVPRSAAASAKLKPGEKILRVDGVPVASLSKPQMLAVFFGREVGARIQLEVADALGQKRRFVELECNEVKIDKK